jgi:hypothetical protein
MTESFFIFFGFPFILFDSLSQREFLVRFEQRKNKEAGRNNAGNPHQGHLVNF